MSQILRQSTQVIVRIGPFMDATNAVTPETGITLAAADQAEALKAAGAATADISGNTWAAVTGAGGWYDLTLTTTDTNTVGTLEIVIQDESVCLPVFARFQVIEEAAFDVMYAASAPGAASPTNITAGTVTTATNVTTVNGLAAGVITAAAIATGAIDADALAADASAEIADAVWDEDATAHQTQGTFGQAIGDPVADANTIYGAVVTGAAGATIAADIIAVKAETASILTDTAEIGAAGAGLTAINLPDQTMNITGNITGNLSGSVGSVTGAVGSVTGLTTATIADAVWDEAQADHVTAGSFGEVATEVASILVDTGTTLDGLITTVDTVVDAIKVQTDKLTFTVANQVDANVQYINDTALTGDGGATPWGPA